MCFLFFVAAAPAKLAQSSNEEYQVKAGFLFHFAQLVDWPPDALNGSEQSISLCLFDDEPHRDRFQEAIGGKPIGDRVLQLRFLHQQQDLPGCNILFLSRDEMHRHPGVLSSLRGQPVLTVGETEDFLKDGGVICFRRERGLVRFDINVSASDAARLRISSRLLLLASQVLHNSADVHGGQ